MSSLVESREVSKKLRNYHEASDEDIDNMMESDNANEATTTDDNNSDHSSNCASSGDAEEVIDDEDDKKRKKKKKSRSQNNPKLNYKCLGYWRENHGHPIFGVSVNHHLPDTDPVVFATVGYNRVTIYQVSISIMFQLRVLIEIVLWSGDDRWNQAAAVLC